nr:MAG TPA: hypothetical protein [Caudoviricetes sp.]
MVFAERKEKLSDDGHIIPNKVGCVNTFIKKKPQRFALRYKNL